MKGMVTTNRGWVRAIWVAVVASPLLVRGELVEIRPLVVRGEALPGLIYGSGEESVASQLQRVPEVDLQVQGIAGGQSDLSIQGSSFSGAGLAINGLSLPNAQTEHFHAALPLPPELFGAPQVLTGFDQSAGSVGFLVGTIDYGILPLHTRRRLSGGISEYDSYWGQILVQQQLEVDTGALGVGAFAGGTEMHKVDFPDNDVSIERAGGQVQFRNAEGDQTDFLLAREKKEFGVRGYYGVNPDWPGDEETDDTLLYLGHTRVRDGHEVRASAYYREFRDDYRLYWTLPGIFENNHRLYTMGAMVDGRSEVGENGLFDWRLTGSEERIRSTALGRFSRRQMSISAIPGYRYDRWLYQVGARMDIFEDTVNEFLPQVSVTYSFDRGISLQAAYSESVRQPSYTELNYESPASLGNEGLENQKAGTAELTLRGGGAAGLRWKAGAFYRRSQDTVDWIRRAPDSARWEAENIGTLETMGVEAGLQWAHEAGSYLAVHYLGLDQSSDADVHASRYALDYAEHLLRLTGYAALGQRASLSYTQALRQQASNPLRGSDRQAYPAAVQAAYVLRHHPNIAIHATVDNLWDDDYEVFPGQEVYAGRRYSAGLVVEW